jgi:hypothetical protein
MIDHTDSDNAGHHVYGRYFSDLSCAQIARQRADEREQRERARVEAYVARLIVGKHYESERVMQDDACRLVVANLGRALSDSEHARILVAVGALWRSVAPVQGYELTPSGRRELLPAIGARVTVVSGPDAGEAGTVVGTRDGMLRVQLDRFSETPYWFLPSEIQTDLARVA